MPRVIVVKEESHEMISIEAITLNLYSWCKNYLFV